MSFPEVDPILGSLDSYYAELDRGYLGSYDLGFAMADIDKLTKLGSTKQFMYEATRSVIDKEKLRRFAERSTKFLTPDQREIANEYGALAERVIYSPKELFVLGYGLYFKAAQMTDKLVTTFPYDFAEMAEITQVEQYAASDVWEWVETAKSDVTLLCELVLGLGAKNFLEIALGQRKQIFKKHKGPIDALLIDEAQSANMIFAGVGLAYRHNLHLMNDLAEEVVAA